MQECRICSKSSDNLVHEECAMGGLAFREVGIIAGWSRRAIREMERRVEKSTYVPPEGKQNMDEVKLRMFQAILGKVQGVYDRMVDDIFIEGAG